MTTEAATATTATNAGAPPPPVPPSRVEHQRSESQEQGEDEYKPSAGELKVRPSSAGHCLYAHALDLPTTHLGWSCVHVLLCSFQASRLGALVPVSKVGISKLSQSFGQPRSNFLDSSRKTLHLLKP